MEIEKDVGKLLKRIAVCKENKIGTSIAYFGNVVDVWEALVEHYNKTGEMLVEMGSDQTSCHNPYMGKFY